MKTKGFFYKLISSIIFFLVIVYQNSYDILYNTFYLKSLKFKEEYLVESEFAYPVSFNGKTKLNILMPIDISEADAKYNLLSMK